MSITPSREQAQGLEQTDDGRLEARVSRLARLIVDLSRSLSSAPRAPRARCAVQSIDGRGDGAGRLTAQDDGLDGLARRFVRELGVHALLERIETEDRSQQQPEKDTVGRAEKRWSSALSTLDRSAIPSPAPMTTGPTIRSESRGLSRISERERAPITVSYMPRIRST